MFRRGRSRVGALVDFIVFRLVAWVRATLGKDVVLIQGAAHRKRSGKEPETLSRVIKAGGFSLVLHGVLLGGLLFPLWRTGQVLILPPAPSPPTVGDGLAPSWVDLVPASSVLPEILAALPSQDEATGNFGSARPSGVGIAVGSPAPAQDRGTNTGKPTPLAFRFDRSTLHARLTNGATVYQPEHERTSRLASSTQAERREPTTGIGDLARTQHQATVNNPAFELPEQNVEANDLPATASDEHPNRKAVGAGMLRGQGPLDAEEGEQRFDVEREGPAQDSRWAPQLSAEMHVGLMDLSAVSAPGPQDGIAGKGEGKQNGSVVQTAQGTAPSVSGGAAATGKGQGGEGEALRIRHELEIGQRIHRFLRFPHHLELMLEQGETIVAFVVTAEGRLAGRVEVIKSAGFSEFDEEAVAAVQRAAPFTPPGRALALSVRVPFQNPVVR